ncbi:MULTISPECIES: YihY/virulence factor BrkB family protein [Tenacibaculum]|uniref:YihY/virulence factor BrkB family protein n=1 Tax=Tenacibaculum TaxID=104267 RepID=UPI001F0B227B|nr:MULTISPECIES: YihY/virulence factor BrkB family protein [Tenacibaculum]MCH3883210.1 YihY/virulence factor BrkB family protein [Tenacibaculum aquimarinum]MCH3885395.1 YihY/virulence factor BrkB family protein [Tenacibaculum aquimarinum]MDO6600945.1 YihY/virulence factor BrkB family protein [Tenacibaculum sp. 1_MG-2023]
MTKELEDKLEKIPIVNLLVKFGKKIKIPGLEGMSLYDVIEMYIIGIVKGALTTRAGGIAFSFFMAIFPFMLFVLSLIPYIPIEGFQDNLFSLIQEMLPPKTFEAVDVVIKDIINNQYGGLLSFGFLASMFLMTNGVNAIFGGFEYSYHVKEFRNVFKSYFVSLGVSLLMVLFLIVTVVLIIYYQIALTRIDKIGWLDTVDLNLFYWGRGLLFLLMIFTIVSLLFRFGTKQGKEIKFFSAGAILTTVLSLFTFYIFGIYVVKFATYNQLYGSIGTLLILMLFVWLNAIILLLGFELNASLYSLRRRNKTFTTPKKL